MEKETATVGKSIPLEQGIRIDCMSREDSLPSDKDLKVVFHII